MSEGKRPIEAYHSWASELVRRFGGLFNEEIFRLSEPSIKSAEVQTILHRIFRTISVFAQGETDLEVALEWEKTDLNSLAKPATRMPASAALKAIQDEKMKVAYKAVRLLETQIP